MTDFSQYRPDPKPLPKVKKPYAGLKRAAIKKKAKKPTGEKDLFLQIWEERPHYSEVSGEYLGEEPNVFFFAHLLGKKAFPQFRLNPDNIMLMTFDEHYQYDHGSPEGTTWDKVFAKKEELKIQYHLPKQTI